MGHAVSAIAQPLAQPSDATRDVFFDGVLGNPHAPGDLPLRQRMDAAQDEGLAGLSGHARDQVGQLAQIVPAHGVAFGRGRLVGQFDVSQFLDRQDRYDPRATDVAQHQRVRHLEQIGAGIEDVVQPLAFQEQGVTFLDDVQCVRLLHPQPCQPAPQGRLVGQDIDREPMRAPGIVGHGLFDLGLERQDGSPSVPWGRTGTTGSFWAAGMTRI